MNRISRILGTPTNRSAARLGNRSFFSGSLALLLVAAGLTSPGAGCVNNSAADTITGDSKTITREQYARRVEAVEKMVADGEVSREDADRRLGRMRLMIVAGRGEGGEVHWDGFKRRIEGAVAAGDLSDEALEGIKKRIEGAVEAGAITREEAAALYEKLEKSE
jgi:polyhydroxyalkanoate synthesis regulator phasin